MLTLIEPRTTSLEALSRRYVTMLEDAGMVNPLSQPITAAAVLADLFMLAGEPVPPAVVEGLQEVTL